MKVDRLERMKGGWFVGNFTPTCLHSDAFEVACKHYRKGDREARHVHKIAVEVTLIAAGCVVMNGHRYQAGDIIVLEPGDATDFEALEDGTAMVVKVPSVPGDKYPG